MLIAYRLLLNVYAGYKNDSERHFLRLLAGGAGAILIAAFAVDLANTSLEMIAVVISVLTGFAFTALFSTYISPVVALPSAKNETDRHDLARLKILRSNFQVRAKFLILIAMICLLCILLLSIVVEPRDCVTWMVESLFGSTAVNKIECYYSIASVAWKALSFCVRWSAFFIFFEAIYTFYRLAETVIATLETLGDYQTAHEQQSREDRRGTARN